MATYGRGQMLGSGINPESFKQDFSGFARAAEIQAQGMANIGERIGGAIKEGVQGYSDYKKMNSDINVAKKNASTMIDSAINLYGESAPGIRSTLETYKAEINNPNLSSYEQGMIASGVTQNIENLINMQMNAGKLQMQQQQLNQQQAPASQPMTVNPFTGLPF
jgi:hypothetical protein